MAICFYCGNKGCDKCGINPDSLKVAPQKKEKFIRRAQFSQIPEQYIGVVWNKDILEKSHPNLNNINFKEYCSRLDTMHNFFKDGLVPAVSAFIHAPSNMGKTILAYSCMQHALNKGIKVAPLIDTLELKRLLTLGGDNPSWKLYNYIDHDNYITSPVCFVTVTKLDKHMEAYTVILELLSRRSRLGLPTFILSKFSLREISQNCIDSNYDSIIDERGNGDPYKYPTIIECGGGK